MFGIYQDTWDCCGLFILIFKIYIFLIDLNDLLMEKKFIRCFLIYNLVLFLPVQFYMYIHMGRDLCAWSL